MAWPFTARDKSYAPNTAVPSSNLNAIQDQIVKVAGSHKVMLFNGFGANGSWEVQTSAGHPWVRLAAGDLFIPVPAREGAVLKKITIKVYNTGAGASWTVRLRASDVGLGAAADVPTSEEWATYTSPALGTQHWLFFLQSTNPGLDGTMPITYQTATQKVWVQIVAPTNGDRVVGVFAEFDQFYT